jgi:hypothetical protein
VETGHKEWLPQSHSAPTVAVRTDGDALRKPTFRCLTHDHDCKNRTFSD